MSEVGACQYYDVRMFQGAFILINELENKISKCLTLSLPIQHRSQSLWSGSHSPSRGRCLTRSDIIRSCSSDKVRVWVPVPEIFARRESDD